MTTHAFLLFIGASSLIAIVPGPNVLLIVSSAAAKDFRGAIPVASGIAGRRSPARARSNYGFDFGWRSPCRLTNTCRELTHNERYARNRQCFATSIF